MTASSVEVTPGSGLKLGTNSYTETAVTVHDQKTIPGELYLPDYTVTNGTAVSVATANSHPLEVMAGASLRVRLRRVEVYQMGLATAAAFCQFQLIRLTTAGTGGTAITPGPVDSTDSASGATGMTLPTVKGTEGTVLWNGTAYFAQTASVSSPVSAPILVIDFDRPRQKPIIIAAGTTNGLCLKNVTAIAAATVFMVAYVTESSF